MATEENPTVMRTVKHKMFSYFTTTEGMKPDGTYGPVPVELQARRGEEVEIAEQEARRGDLHGAFFTEEELEEQSNEGEEVAEEPDDDNVELSGAPQSADVPDLVEAPDEDITVWLDGTADARRPSIPQVLAAVNAIDEENRPAVAEKVREAEEASDRDTRSTLVEPLQAIEVEDEAEEEEVEEEEEA